MTGAPLLTTRQVAELLGVSVETVLRWWRSGTLPGFRIATNALRFDPEEITAWLEARRDARGTLGGSPRQPAGEARAPAPPITKSPTPRRGEASDAC